MDHLFICDHGNTTEVAPLCRSLGVGIEVQAFYDPRACEQDPSAPGTHRQLINGISPVSMHGCFGDLCPGSFDALVRGVARQRFEQSYQVALALGARHIVFHHGYVPHTSPYAGWIARSTAFWQDFLAGKDPGIRIHLENLVDVDPGLICDVVQSIDRPNLDINLDIGHVHFASKSGVVQWIERLGVRIGYVHLHDNHGQADEHLGLGQGTIPVLDVCQALNELAPQACWGLEAEGDGIQVSLEWLIKHGFLIL